ncbi:TPA: ATP synthase F1 subunit delta, partial [Clostridium perfringens]
HLERNNTLLAEVKSVVQLTEDEVKRLVEKLENKYSKKILLKQEIDKSIIGGLFVRVGDDVIDGTVKSRLDDMKLIMLKRE